MRKIKSHITPEIGVKIGRLTVIDFCRLPRKDRKTKQGLVCMCDCGKIVKKDYQTVKRQATLSCGCLYSPDWTGTKFGRLTVLHRDSSVNDKWFCKCDCGIVKSVTMCHLKTGRIVSCGCKKASINGKSRDKVYHAYYSMLSRCYREKDISFPNYGAKGVSVCDRWRDSFSNFYEDVGNPPTKDHSLDRFPDTKGNYEPSNFRWATDAEQQGNRSINKMLTYNNETLCAYQMAQKYGVITGGVFSKRIRDGWEIERALKTPKRIKK